MNEFKVGEKVLLKEEYIKHRCLNYFVKKWYEKYKEVKPIVVGFNNRIICLSFEEYILKEINQEEIEIRFFREARIYDTGYKNESVHWHTLIEDIEKIKTKQLELF